MYSIEKNRFKNIAIQILIILLSSFLGIIIYILYLDSQIYNYEKVAIGTKLLRTVENNGKVEENLENSIKGVVGISKLKKNGTSIFLENGVESLGLGTGVIVSKKGYILTNEHVVGNEYNNCYVTLDTGISYKGSVVWADEEIDLAIIKIGIDGLKSVALGDSSKVSIGQKTYAVGNPVGFEFRQTVTSGIISGINRTIKIKNEDNTYSYMEGLIQTDATINEGNSGGPLINEKGEIIGITSVKVNEADGIGFAIPINIVKPIIKKFEEEGKFEEAYLGIYGYDREVIPYLKDVTDFENGVYVENINKRSNLKNANIKEGDIIVKIDDLEINRMCNLREYIYSKKPGDVVSLTVKRNKNEFVLKIKLSKKL